jgi:APA family basic amino acid/polyamine antiporter
MSETTGDSTRHASARPDELQRRLGLGDSTLLIVASVIGAGIFFAPGQVAELLPHPGWIAAAWLTGALISLAGALAFAELGALYPHAGGDYVYLREGIHPVAGFLVGWLTFFAIYAGTLAALAAALGEGLADWWGFGEPAVVPIAIAVTLGVSGINYLGVRWGAAANNFTSALKLTALVAFGALGPLFGDGDWGRLWTAPAATESVTSVAGGGISLLKFGMAMSPILFTYLGWNAAVYVASEIRKPERNVPTALVLGLAICSGVYLLMNGVYLYALPMNELAGVGNAGEAAASALFGGFGGTLLAIFVMISILGTLNATALVGPRIAYAMALDGLFFAGSERVSRQFRTPHIAIGVQAVVVVGLLLLLRNFPNALSFTTFAILLASVGDIAALYRLRRVRADLPRPYRTWGYPWVPGIYLLANVSIAVALAWGSPFECAVSFCMLLAGLPFYWFFARRSPSSASGVI